MSTAHVGAPGAVQYRERLSPSLWILVSAALAGPMAALVFTPLDTTLSLVIGAVVSILVVVLLMTAAPVIELRDGMLHAGRAAIEVEYLGEATALFGEEARAARGRELDPRAWHLLRGGIEPVVRIVIDDADDPAPYWILSTRTPDRLAAALRRARTTPRTPCR